MTTYANPSTPVRDATKLSNGNKEPGEGGGAEDLVLRKLGLSSAADEGDPVCALDHFDDADAAVGEVAAHAFAEGVCRVDPEAGPQPHGEVRRVLVERRAQRRPRRGRRSRHGGSEGRLVGASIKSLSITFHLFSTIAQRRNRRGQGV